jgi:hypothetical protein
LIIDSISRASIGIPLFLHFGGSNSGPVTGAPRGCDRT